MKEGGGIHDQSVVAVDAVMLRREMESQQAARVPLAAACDCAISRYTASTHSDAVISCTRGCYRPRRRREVAIRCAGVRFRCRTVHSTATKKYDPPTDRPTQERCRLSPGGRPVARVAAVETALPVPPSVRSRPSTNISIDDLPASLLLLLPASVRRRVFTSQTTQRLQGTRRVESRQHATS